MIFGRTHLRDETLPLKVVVQSLAGELDIGHFVRGRVGHTSWLLGLHCLLLLLLLTSQLIVLLRIHRGLVLVLLSLLLLLLGSRHLLVVGVNVLGSEWELLGGLLLQLLVQLLLWRLLVLIVSGIILLLLLWGCRLGIVVLRLILDLLRILLLGLLILEIGLQRVSAKELSLELV